MTIHVSITLKKLDRSTHVAYEQSLTNPCELNLIGHLLKILELSFQSLVTLTCSASDINKRITPSTKQTSLTTKGATFQFGLRKEKHLVFSCPI